MMLVVTTGSRYARRNYVIDLASEITVVDTNLLGHYESHISCYRLHTFYTS